jgi:hypothetical protein
MDERLARRISTHPTLKAIFKSLKGGVQRKTLHGCADSLGHKRNAALETSGSDSLELTLRRFTPGMVQPRLILYPNLSLNE